MSTIVKSLCKSIIAKARHLYINVIIPRYKAFVPDSAYKGAKSKIIRKPIFFAEICYFYEYFQRTFLCSSTESSLHTIFFLMFSPFLFYYNYNIRIYKMQAEYFYFIFTVVDLCLYIF